MGLTLLARSSWAQVILLPLPSKQLVLQLPHLFLHFLIHKAERQTDRQTSKQAVSRKHSVLFEPKVQVKTTALDSIISFPGLSLTSGKWTCSLCRPQCLGEAPCLPLSRSPCSGWGWGALVLAVFVIRL